MKTLVFYSLLFAGLSWVRPSDGGTINRSMLSDSYRTNGGKYLTTTSPVFLCPDGIGRRCYYESFQLTPSITGNYNFVVESVIDIDAHLYYAPFHPDQPNTNLIQSAHRHNQERNVQCIAGLRANDAVVLVVATYHPSPNVPFTVNIDGPSVLNIQPDQQFGTQVTTSGPNLAQKNDLSPLIKHFSWGRVVVEGQKQDFKDVKLFPGGAVPWDWRKTGTRHEPGIQPGDLEEFFDYNCDIFILSRGVDRRLKTMAKTRQFLESYGNIIGKDYFILQSDRAVKKYNELAKKKQRVCAVIHSTC